MNDLTSDPRFRVFDDRVLVEVLDVEAVSPGGIVFADETRTDKRELSWTRRGRVLAVGPGRLLKNGTRAPCLSRPGDVVVYRQMGVLAGLVELELDGKTLVSMEERKFVLAVEEESHAG